MAENFTHIDENGNAVMVDVTEKNITKRTAIACGTITMSRECYKKVLEHRMAKGDVLSTAQIAGIMGAKRTSELIPLCHILPITSVRVEFSTDDTAASITAYCTVSCEGKTGVEMEALTGASTALLTVYDMCKAVDKRMVLGAIHLVEKHGGKSGDFYFDTKA